MSITKNDNGTLSIGDIQIVSSYDKETKKHTFTLLKTGRVPVQHVGNHLTLRNNLERLVAELEASTGEEPAEEAPETISEAILEPVEFEEIEVDYNSPASDSEDYNLFKEYLEKFANATTPEDRDAAADTAMIIALRMDISAV